MEWLRNIIYFSMLILLLALNSSIADARWISFSGSVKREKPSARVITSNSSGTVVEFIIAGIEVDYVTEGNEIFQKLRFPGYFTTLDIGKPQLPVISELIGIPDVVNVKAIIVNSEVTTLIDYSVYPFQEPVFEGENKAFIIDNDLYQKDSLYPEFIVEVGTPTIWRDIRNVCLKIFPVRYNPATGELKVYHRITVKLEYYGVSDGNELYAPRKPISRAWEKIYKNKILNFDGFVKRRKHVILERSEESP